MNPFTKMAYMALNREREGYNQRIKEIDRIAACMLSDVVPSLDPVALEPLFSAEKRVLGKKKEYEYLPFTIYHDRASNKEVAEKLRKWESEYGSHEKLEMRRGALADGIFKMKAAKQEDVTSLDTLRGYLRPIFEHNARFKHEEITPETVSYFEKFRPLAFTTESYRSGRKALQSCKSSGRDFLTEEKAITALSHSIGLQANRIYEQQQELKKAEKHLARYKDIAQYHRTHEKMLENLRDSAWQRARENPEYAAMLIQDFGVLPGLKLAIEERRKLGKLCDETGEAMHDTRTSSSAAYWDSVFYGR